MDVWRWCVAAIDVEESRRLVASYSSNFLSAPPPSSDKGEGGGILLFLFTNFMGISRVLLTLWLSTPAKVVLSSLFGFY